MASEMAAKRLLDGSVAESDQPEEKRTKRTTPALSAAFREAMVLKSFENVCLSALEPLLRRVVQEEVERGVARVANKVDNRSPSLQLQSADQEATLQLVFTKKLSLPIFTGSKIEDEDNNPLQIRLIDTRAEERRPVTLPFPFKVEIVVLDGDFPRIQGEEWTSEEFNNSILKEREGKRPLLTGELGVTIRDGVASIGELEFTDNSSWIRSRTFRLGARVVPGASPVLRIKEAKTEAFQVKDHRGELYRKHYPPSLHDDVWRLERIGKDGVFHGKLGAEGIHTVQQFLKAWVVDSVNLRKMLGIGMSDRMWEGTMKHALTCEMGNKLYVHRDGPCMVLLNPICQVVAARFDGQVYHGNALNTLQRSYVERMVFDAFKRWDTLQQVDAVLGLGALSQNEQTVQMPGEPQREIAPMSQRFGRVEAGMVNVNQPSYAHSNLQLEYSEWHPNLTAPPATLFGGHAFLAADSGSDDDSNAHRRRVVFRGS